MTSNNSYPRKSSEVRAAIASCSGAFLGVGLFSALLNVLALTGSMYMLQVYDRVIPSRSFPTLIGLSIIMLMLYFGYGALEMVRTRITSRIGIRIDRALRDRVFSLVLMTPIRVKAGTDGQQAVRDLDQIRGFMTSSGPLALFDLPWMPLYIGMLFLLHPWLGFAGIGGAVILMAFAILTELRTRKPTRSATSSAASRHALGEAARRNAEIIQALGMGGRISALWSASSETYLAQQVGGGDVAATYGAMSKVFRFVLQSAVLGLGAYLVINGEATGGVMIAASILVSRALAPIEIAIANWRGFLGARQSADRLGRLLGAMPVAAQPMVLPKAAESVSVEGLWIGAPGDQRAIVQNASFRLAAGDGLGIIGPSASGKSTLVRALVGAWLPQRGQVRLDDATLDQWTPEALGRNIGYLPQDIELFEGSVAENIARFDPEADGAGIIAAATAAGVHTMILNLPQGYDTRIGEGGAALSAGQRQRIALARALYGDPFLVVLDEPNSNLDADGDVALTQAIASVRQRGGVVIVIAHRPSALAGLDLLIVMAAGQIQALGPKDEVLRGAVQMASSALPPAPAAQLAGSGNSTGAASAAGRA